MDDSLLSRLQQQRLQLRPKSRDRASSPTLVFSFIFGLGFLCLAIGAALTAASAAIIEKPFHYSYSKEKPYIDLTLNLTDGGMEGQGRVYIYYQLDNFNQNLRRLSQNWDEGQLLEADYTFDCQGETHDTRAFWKLIDNSMVNNVLTWVKNMTWGVVSLEHIVPRQNKSADKTVVPCGALAATIFNDTVELFDETRNMQVPLSNKEISWPADLIRTKNPTEPGCGPFENTVKPEYWSEHICNMTKRMQNEDFLVWMRPAARFTFRKPWRYVNDSVGLPAGIYTLRIGNNYRMLNATKSVIVTTVNWAGGKSNFLGIAYLVVGSIILAVAAALLYIHICFGSQFENEYGLLRWRG